MSPQMIMPNFVTPVSVFSVERSGELTRLYGKGPQITINSCMTLSIKKSMHSFMPCAMAYQDVQEFTLLHLMHDRMQDRYAN